MRRRARNTGIKILPIAEVGAKDEFIGIKSATQDDVLAAHRVPPQLLGIVPAQGSAFGNPTEAKATFFELEIEPLQSVFLEINDQVGVEAVRLSRPRSRDGRKPAPPPDLPFGLAERGNRAATRITDELILATTNRPPGRPAPGSIAGRGHFEGENG